MNNAHIGELASLITAFSWTIGSMLFERAVRRSGVLMVNTLKVFLGSLYLLILSLFATGQFFPMGISSHAWIFMSVSGILGFVIGDYFLFNAYAFIGSRMSMLLMSVSVPLTVVFSFFIYGGSLSVLSLLGIVVTLGGIIITVHAGGRPSKNKIPHAYDVERNSAAYRKGVIFALLASVAMAGSTLLSKVGSTGVPPIAATQIRLLSAFAGFLLIVIVKRKGADLSAVITNGKALGLIALASVFGPFIGVGCLIFALQHTDAGIVSTITSLTPVLIIPPSILILKRHVAPLEILGSCIAVGGVSLLFV